MKKEKTSRRLVLPALIAAAISLTACGTAKQQMEDGIAQLDRGEYAAAADTFMTVLENMQWYDGLDRTEVLLYRGEALLGEGEYESARKVYEGLREKDAENADYPLYSGIASLGAKDYIAAEESFLAAAENGNEEAYEYAGQAAEAQKDYEKAASYYQKALNEEPENVSVYASVGRCMIAGESYEEGLRILKEGISAAEKTGGEETVLQELLWEEAVIYEYMGDYAEARDKFAAYLQQYPEDAEAQKEYAFLLTR